MILGSPITLPSQLNSIWKNVLRQPRKEIEYRNQKDIDYTDFVLNTDNSPLVENYKSMTSVTDLSQAYDLTIRSILDIHAPLKKKTITVRPPSPRFTDEIHQLKLRKRRMESR